jgi:hypothetical protein
MKIKANQELFGRYNALSIRVRLLSNAIQNDCEIDNIDEYISGFIAIYEDVNRDLSELNRNTIEYLRKG